MRTDIGRNLHGSQTQRAAAIGLLAVALDLWLVWLNRYPESLDGRWAVALVALAALLGLANGDLPSFGLNAPTGGWRMWIRFTLVLGILACVCIAAAAGVWLAIGGELPLVTTAPSEIVPAFVRMCLLAPVLEEAIYRVVLCAPLAVAIGPWRTVAVSGITFGFLHVIYGNPSPENLLGGFFLAWAYLRSGSLYVPLLLHAVGNLLALCGQVGLRYWQQL